MAETAVYFNGLERTSVGVPEKLFARYMKLRGVDLFHAEVDWHNLNFTDIFAEATDYTRDVLQDVGRLTIIGASAGGSLGVNVFSRIRKEDQKTDVSLISLSGRLRIGDRQHLEETALYRPGKQPSRAFIDSVVRCDEVATIQLTPDDKRRMLTVLPMTDGVVPPDTMTVDGVEQKTVPMVGHVPGIALGALVTPGLINNLHSNQEVA